LVSINIERECNNGALVFGFGDHENIPAGYLLHSIYWSDFPALYRPTIVPGARIERRSYPFEGGSTVVSEVTLYGIAYICLLAYGLLILGYFVPRDYRKHGTLSPLVATLQAALFFAYGGFPVIYLHNDWPASSVPPIQYYIGLLLLALGVVTLVALISRFGFMRSLGGGEQKLYQSGLYASSRNPQAIACSFYVFGFFLLWPSWYAAGWGLLYFLLIHLMVLAEERHLRRTHGQAYADYCIKVPRYYGWNKKQKQPSGPRSTQEKYP